MDRVARLCADAQYPQLNKAQGTPDPTGVRERCQPSHRARLPQRGGGDAGQCPPGSSVESGWERQPAWLLAWDWLLTPVGQRAVRTRGFPGQGRDAPFPQSPHAGQSPGLQGGLGICWPPFSRDSRPSPWAPTHLGTQWGLWLLPPLGPPASCQIPLHLLVLGIRTETGLRLLQSPLAHPFLGEDPRPSSFCLLTHRIPHGHPVCRVSPLCSGLSLP